MECARGAPMFGRWFMTRLSLFAACSCSASAASAQTSPESSSAASTTTTASPEPESPLAMPHLLVEDPRREVPQQRRPHRVLLVTGLVVLGGSYAASAVVAAESDRSADEKL